jgi:hypothetical protein
MNARDLATVTLALKLAARRLQWDASDFDEQGFRVPATDGTILTFHVDKTIWNVSFEDRWGYERLADPLAALAFKIHNKLSRADPPQGDANCPA